MKPLFLLLTLLLASSAAHAQWVLQPFSFLNTIAPYRPTAATLHIVDAQTVWATAITQYQGVKYGDNEVARTSDGGATWTVQSVPRGKFGAGVISSIVGLSATTALVCTSNGANAGRILKTVDGGKTWTSQTTAAQFSNPDSYAHFMVAFSPTELLCVGNPITSPASYFEMYRSQDAGLTWTAVLPLDIPTALPGEMATSCYKAQVGSNIWFSTTAGRIFHSTDRGLSWSASPSGLSTDGPVAFRDTLNGLAFEPAAGGLVRTTDGGATWQPVAYTGPAHRILAAVPGTGQYLSVGQGPDAGTSYSRDNGATWLALETTRSHASLAVYSLAVAWSGAVEYTATSRAGLGVYRLASPVLGNRSGSPVPAISLTIFPNPSLDGRFTIAWAGQPTGETQVRVLDALGRCVLTHLVPPVLVLPLTFDLGPMAHGLFTVQVHSSYGVAQQKLVIP